MLVDHLSGNITYYGAFGSNMKEIDDTDPSQSESEGRINDCEDCDRLAHHVNKVTGQLRKHALVCQARIEALEVQVADLHHRGTVSRQQATDQDPEWY